jgi:HSP20 family protein
MAAPLPFSARRRLGRVNAMAHEHDLFANFERMRREIDELFGDVFGRGALTPRRRPGFTPPVDVSYADDPARMIVTAALPGVRLDDLDIEIRQRELHLSGHRRPGESETRVYQQIEIEHGPFHRVIELGADVVAEHTQATFEEGMLRIELPLVVPQRSRQAIPIEVSREAEPPRARDGGGGDGGGGP